MLRTAGSAPPLPFKYWAFISYSHQDASWGDWLHRVLETYTLPKSIRDSGGREGAYPNRLYPVFRDKEELPASADLGPTIEDALRASRSLIVICSPNSARSRWVEAEVLAFKRLGRQDRIHCLIIAGEPNAGDKSEDGAAECFCEALRYELESDGSLGSRRVEPMAADARPGIGNRADAKLKLVAGVLGIGFDELRRREVQRRQRRLAVTTVASLALIAVLAYLAAQAVFARRSAERNLRSSVIRSLPARAVARGRDDPITALLLAAQAVRFESSAASLDALVQTLVAAENLHFSVPLRRGNLAARASVFSPSGSTLAVLYSDTPDEAAESEKRSTEKGTIVLWDVSKGTPLPGDFAWDATPNISRRFGVTWDGKAVALETGHSPYSPGWRLWDPQSRRPLPAAAFTKFDPSSLAGSVGDKVVVSHDRRFVAALEPGFLEEWVPEFKSEGLDPERKGLWIWDRQAKNLCPVQQVFPSTEDSYSFAWSSWDSLNTHLAFTPDDRYVVAWHASFGNRYGGVGIYVWQTSVTPQSEKPLTAVYSGLEGMTFRSFSEVALSPDATLFAASDRDGSISLRRTADANLVSAPLRGHLTYLRTLAFDGTGRYLRSIADDGTQIVWRLGSLSPFLIREERFESRVISLSLCAKLPCIAVALAGGIELRDIESGRRIAMLPLPEGTEPSNVKVECHPSQPLLAVGGSRSVHLWSLDSSGARQHAVLALQDEMRGGAIRLSFEPGGRYLAASSQGFVQLWELPGSQERLYQSYSVLPGGFWTGNGLALSKDARYLSGRSDRGEVGVYSVEDLRKAHSSDELHSKPSTASSPTMNYSITPLEEPPKEALSFSPDGRRLLYARENRLYLWDVERGRLLTPPEGIGAESRDILAAAYSPSASLIASASVGGVELRDGTSLSPIGLQLPAIDCICSKEDSVEACRCERLPHVRFSPDGRILAYTTAPEVISLWDVSPESWIVKACRKAGRNLTTAEWREYLGDAFPYEPLCRP